MSKLHLVGRSCFSDCQATVDPRRQSLQLAVNNQEGQIKRGPGLFKLKARIVAMDEFDFTATAEKDTVYFILLSLDLYCFFYSACLHVCALFSVLFFHPSGAFITVAYVNCHESRLKLEMFHSLGAFIHLFCS